ncbi:MAG: hypothetical protein WA765_02470 [Candidatus Acidiferrum sp.]
MSSRKTNPLCHFFLLVVAVFALAATANASVRIGGASLRANGQLAQGFQYTGACPVALKFGWGVISSEPTTVEYTFVRSDGGHQTSALSANLPGGGRSTPIYDDWQLGANTPEFQNFHGWVELQIESPNAVSQRIAFTLHCGGSAAAAIRIGGASLRANGQLAQGFQYTGGCPVALKFGWGVIAADSTQINYTFVRSDGGRLNGASTADLPGGNRSIPIYYDWQLGANTPQFQSYTGWVELQIESPAQVKQKITFTLHCG